MKLFTHNLLKCNGKKCNINNYPLKIVATKVDKQAVEFNKDMMTKFLKKVDVEALISGAKDLGISNIDLSNLKEEDLIKENILKELHSLLFETVLVDGNLICNGCGLTYPVKNGIPDMVVDDE